MSWEKREREEGIGSSMSGKRGLGDERRVREAAGEN